MELTYPRFVHAEFMTHRDFSRNAASSRAIPVSKMIEAIKTDPVIPVWWGKAQSGMQAKEEVDPKWREWCVDEWLAARDHAVTHVEKLVGMGLHKQIPNRILEPWMWITVIASATRWSNFFALRVHPDAQPEIQKIAEMAYAVREASTPAELEPGEWHLPLVGPEYGDDCYDGYRRNPVNKAISVGRCARVSYLTHDGIRDPQKDIELHDRLKSQTPGHWSPFEHVATPTEDPHDGNRFQKEVQERRSGNFVGWKQYRKEFPNECL